MTRTATFSSVLAQKVTPGLNLNSEQAALPDTSAGRPPRQGQGSTPGPTPPGTASCPLRLSAAPERQRLGGAASLRGPGEGVAEAFREPSQSPGAGHSRSLERLLGDGSRTLLLLEGAQRLEGLHQLLHGGHGRSARAGGTDPPLRPALSQAPGGARLPPGGPDSRPTLLLPDSLSPARPASSGQPRRRRRQLTPRRPSLPQWMRETPQGAASTPQLPRRHLESVPSVPTLLPRPRPLSRAAPPTPEQGPSPGLGRAGRACADRSARPGVTRTLTYVHTQARGLGMGRGSRGSHNLSNQKEGSAPSRIWIRQTAPLLPGRLSREGALGPRARRAGSTRDR